MRILYVSALAESVDLALRCQDDGHQVRYYIHSPTEERVAQGMLDKVPSWEKHVGWADLVVFDDVAQKVEHALKYRGGEWAAEVRNKGKPCIGGSPATDRMENDRIFGQQIAQQVGLSIAPMQRFTEFGKAEEFVREHGGGWALKHNGQVARDLATVQFDPNAMVEFLQWLAKCWGDLAHGQPVDFVLQEAVKGAEIAITGLFNGREFVGAYVNQEIKKLMSGDEGPSTGQTGEIGFHDMGRLYREALLPVSGYLAAQGYRGCMDLNCIATEDRIVPLEWTSRFGYPTVSSIVEMVDAPVADWLHALATGEGTVPWHDGYCATVVVGSGPFPREDEELAKRIVLLPDEDLDWDRVHLNEVQENDEGQLESAGSMGYLVVVTARGRGIAEARNNCYRQVDKIKVLPFRIVRRDIGDRAIETLPKLRSWGWVG